MWGREMQEKEGRYANDYRGNNSFNGILGNGERKKAVGVWLNNEDLNQISR